MGPFGCPYSSLINIPELCTDLGIASFTAADVLEVFGVEKGFLAYMAVVHKIVAEGATCEIDIGWAATGDTHLGTADPDGFVDGLSINATGFYPTPIGVGGGYSTTQGVLFLIDTTIDITFGHSATDTAVFNLAIPGCNTDSKAAVHYQNVNGLDV